MNIYIRQELEEYNIKEIDFEISLDIKFYSISKELVLPMADINMLLNSMSGLDVLLTIIDKSGDYRIFSAKFLSRFGLELRFCCGNGTPFAMDALSVKGWVPEESARYFCKRQQYDESPIIKMMAGSARFIAKNEKIKLGINRVIIATPEEDSFSVRLKEE